MSTTTNVAALLFERETGGALGRSGGKSATVREREKDLQGWMTNEASRHCFSECCTLNNTPRSTIAATINRDGTLIASTHGDHTVKLVDFSTGNFVKELSGHRRTPWTVKFHPLHAHLLVSGSLDYQIKLWDTDLGICLQTKDFGRQISSVCFHPSGRALAIAAGHKLHLWEFNEDEMKFGRSTCIFRTNRTIRTVHFSPGSGDMIMASERVDPSSVSPETNVRFALRSGEFVPVLQPPPQVPWNDLPQDPWVRGTQGMTPVTRGGNGMVFSVRDNGLGPPSEPSPLTSMAQGFMSPLANVPSATPSEPRSSDAILRQVGSFFHPPPPMVSIPSLEHISGAQRLSEDPQFSDSQRLNNSQLYPSGSYSSRLRTGNPRPLHIAHPQTLPALSLMPMNNANVELTRSGQPNELPRPPPRLWNQPSNAAMPMPPVSGSNDLPHVTKLVLYKFEIDKPHTTLNHELLRIDSAVICSEMGAHISPCGRMMVVCVALPSLDRRTSGVSGPPGFLYELRVISLERQNFGEVLRSRAISAGHCLTSVQFSPGSEMILLSYGRKHAALLRCLEMNGATVAQIHTLLELYSAKSLVLVRVMHSAEDEANTASFHPYSGEGIVYGTKNGKLRILRHKRTHCNGDGGEIKDYENELLEVLEDEMN